MKKYLVKYSSRIVVVALLFISGIVIYKRGGFENENITENIAPIPTTTQELLPTELSTPTLTPTPTPTRPPVLAPRTSTVLFTPLPIGTIPSIVRSGEEEDD